MVGFHEMLCSCVCVLRRAKWLMGTILERDYAECMHTDDTDIREQP